ncbi:MAG: hypothetical protein AB9880_00435 [Christensenellales bacterium]
MAFVKCPKCELNYMDENDKMCKVCYREIHGSDMPEESELCTICNEAPALPGKEVCLFCLKEMNGEKPPSSDDVEPVSVEDESVSTMDEIAPDINDGGIPEPEFQEIDKDLSLEEMEEKEDADDDEENEDN